MRLTGYVSIDIGNATCPVGLQKYLQKPVVFLTRKHLLFIHTKPSLAVPPAFGVTAFFGQSFGYFEFVL